MVAWARSTWRWCRGLPRRVWTWATSNTHEAWGYVVWGTMGVVVAIPELMAAIGGQHIPWPTISGTVGYLEYWHSWVALIVVSVLIWGALHAVRVSSTATELEDAPDSNPNRQLVCTAGGRLSVARRAQPIRPIVYFPLALAVVVAGSAIVRIDRPGDKYLLGEVLYSLIGFWWIVLPGWLAYKHGRVVPFPTLFRTMRNLEQRARIVAAVFAAGIAVLLIHLALYPWPSVIPDLQDLHHKYERQRHDEKKQKEPSAYAQ
jgi:hypothetical protein